MQQTLRRTAEMWIVAISIASLTIFAFAGNALAATTISANIVTEGTLAVTSTSTLTGAVTAGSTLAVTTNATVGGTLGVTGVATLASLVATTADINAGTIDNTAIGLTTPLTGAFTTLGATGALTASGGGALTGTWTDLGTVTTVDINGGTIDAAAIGGATPAAGAFTTLSSSGAATLNSAGVTGALTVGTTLDVTGATTMAAATLSGTLTANGDTVIGSAATDDLTINAEIRNVTAQTYALIFEGATDNANETVFTITDPTGDNIITFPDSTGTVALTSDVGAIFQNIDPSNGTTAEADGSSDTLLLVDGANVTITGSDPDTITFAVTTFDGVIGGTTPAAATFTTLNATGGGALTGTWTDLGTVTTVDINGGTADAVTIGGATPGAATFTTLAATGNTTLSGSLAYYELTTVYDATAAITVAETGSTYYITNTANDADTYTLPAPADGLVYRFVVNEKWTTTDVVIVTTGSSNIINGIIDANSTMVPCADEDTITFAFGAETEGDWVELRSNGADWFVSGAGLSGGSITCTGGP
ncbi:MAG: hypothetical protein ABIH21_02240 [Patescibacteria group bacterium]